MGLQGVPSGFSGEISAQNALQHPLMIKLMHYSGSNINELKGKSTSLKQKIKESESEKVELFQQLTLAMLFLTGG